ncbi:MAG TPA: CcmD family protein [Gaiellaceae bacterium]
MIPLAVTMTEVKYVAAVYLVVFLFVLAYLLIHVTKLQRLEREVDALVRRERERPEPERETAHVG